MSDAAQRLELQTSFMGGLRLHLGEYDLTRSALPKKAQAILCYLILNPRTHSRQEIAGKFWPEVSESKARVSLRVALNKMKEQHLDTFLIAPRPTIAFDHDTNYWCDVEAFENILNEFRRADEKDINLLKEAVDLYRGDFLDGFDAEDAFGFDEWMLNQREYLRQLALHALDDLVNLFLGDNQFAAGIEYAHRLLELEPWRESAHRQLMWLFARSGNRPAALEQYEKCKEILLNDLGIEPDPETTAVYQEIKNLEYSTRPFQPLPPLSESLAAKGPPFQAPPVDKNFVGRLQQLARLEAALTAVSGNKRYGLVGMGGIGKTTLAIHLAHQLQAKFADGVLWATAVATDPMEIAEKWANAFGYDFAGLKTLEERTQALRAMLAEKKVLIIVDDVFVASAVKLLLPDPETTAVLITSRHTDVVFNLDARPINLEELTPENSRQLLANYVGAERVDKEREAADRICALVQHLPLAIAIAGGYLNSRPRRPLTSFVDQLQSETDRLGLDHADREVRASISISWQGLDEVQKRIFSTLGVFDGRDFSAAASAAVAEMDYYQALDRLDDLVRLSLLQHCGDLRYQQHALLADFAKVKLGREKAVYQKLAAYFLNFARNAFEDYTVLSQEWDNLRAGVETAYRQRMWQEVIDYTNVLREPWFRHGRYSQAREAFAYAQEAAMTLEDEAALTDTWLYLGEACMEQGDFDEAWNWLEKSLNEFREQGNQLKVAINQTYLARIGTNIAKNREDFKEASSRLAESLSIYRELNDQHGVAFLLYRQARLAYRSSQIGEGLELCQEAISLFEYLDDPIGLCRVLRWGTFLALELGLSDKAADWGNRAYALAKECGDTSELAMAYLNLGRIYLHLEEIEDAQEMLNESLSRLKIIGDRYNLTSVYYWLCLVFRSKEAYVQGLQVGERCLRINTEIGDLTGVAWIKLRIGDCLFGLNKMTEAHKSWEESLLLATELESSELITLAENRLSGKSAWVQRVQQANDRNQNYKSLPEDNF